MSENPRKLNSFVSYIIHPRSKLTESRIPQKKADYADWAYMNYVRWELEVKRPAIELVKALFERAINDHPSNVEIWDAFLEYSVRPRICDVSYLELICEV